MNARRIGGYAVNVLCILVILVGAAWLLPSAFGYSRYVIVGGSMSPTIELGSVAFEREVSVKELQVGDVITYLPPPDTGVPNLVTHRIVAIERDPQGKRLFQTQGDANADPDPWEFALRDDVQPVVELAVPYAGHALIALADRETRMTLIGGPAALIALIALGELVRNVRSERRSDPHADSSAEPQLATA